MCPFLRLYNGQGRQAEGRPAQGGYLAPQTDARTDSRRRAPWLRGTEKSNHDLDQRRKGVGWQDRIQGSLALCGSVVAENGQSGGDASVQEYAEALMMRCRPIT